MTQRSAKITRQIRENKKNPAIQKAPFATPIKSTQEVQINKQFLALAKLLVTNVKSKLEARLNKTREIGSICPISANLSILPLTPIFNLVNATKLLAASLL